jgi:hypothetical protein
MSYHPGMLMPKFTVMGRCRAGSTGQAQQAVQDRHSRQCSVYISTGMHKTYWDAAKSNRAGSVRR